MWLKYHLIHIWIHRESKNGSVSDEKWIAETEKISTQRTEFSLINSRPIMPKRSMVDPKVEKGGNFPSQNGLENMKMW